ncbi:MAG: hypothetical protein WD876_00055 [Candidatus Pacearchaeota archaeon]
MALAYMSLVKIEKFGITVDGPREMSVFEEASNLVRRILFEEVITGNISLKDHEGRDYSVPYITESFNPFRIKRLIKYLQPRQD